MDIIFAFLIKVIIGFIVAYFVAAFLVSLKRLMPFLAILTSIAIMIVYYIMEKTGNQELYPYIVIMCVFTQVFYQGEGFMEVRIQENAYRLVSIERKWESLFEEYDSYVLHFEPREIGGFFENAIIYGIFFIIYYSFAKDTNGIGYAYPIYIILMSLADILYIFAIQFNIFIHWIVHTLVIASTIYIGLTGEPFVQNSNKGPTDYFKAAEKLAKTNYSSSYEFLFESYSKVSAGSYEYDGGTGILFVYDSALKAGGLTKDFDDDSEHIFEYIVTKDDRFNNQLIRYVNEHRSAYDFEYVGPTSEVGGPLKYDNFDHVFDSYIEFNRARYDVSTILRSGDILTISYTKTFNSGDSYEVRYNFTTKDKKQPVSLNYIQLNTYVGDKKYLMKYTPVSGNTKLLDSFDQYGHIKGYIYDMNNNPSVGETYGIDISYLLTEELNSFDLAADYDFTLKVRLENEIYYVYDAQSKNTVEYINNSTRGQNAANSNNFYSYRPNNVYFNYEEFGYSIDNHDYIDLPFYSQYTGNYDYITDMIIRMFVDTTLIQGSATQEGNYLVFSCLVENYGIAFEPVNYKFYYVLDNGEYTLNKVNIYSDYEDVIVDFTMYFDNKFDIDGYMYMYI